MPPLVQRSVTLLNTQLQLVPPAGTTGTRLASGAYLFLHYCLLVACESPFPLPEKSPSAPTPPPLPSSLSKAINLSPAAACFISPCCLYTHHVAFFTRIIEQ